MTRTTPKAFTEQGVYMLATVLKSQRATDITIIILEDSQCARRDGFRDPISKRGEDDRFFEGKIKSFLKMSRRTELYEEASNLLL